MQLDEIILNQRGTGELRVRTGIDERPSEASTTSKRCIHTVGRDSGASQSNERSCAISYRLRSTPMRTSLVFYAEHGLVVDLIHSEATLSQSSAHSRHEQRYPSFPSSKVKERREHNAESHLHQDARAARSVLKSIINIHPSGKRTSHTERRCSMSIKRTKVHSF